MTTLPLVLRSAAILPAIIAASFAIGCDEPPKKDVPPPPNVERHHRVRIATFNVHRLFDTICDTQKCRHGDYEPLPSQKQYDEKVASIASAIWDIDADIVLLQEIEKESILADIQKRLSDEIYPAYAFGECGYDASLDVGILARGSIDAVGTYRSGFEYVDESGKPRAMSRELLRADIRLPNDIKISAFTTHFISRVSDPDGDRRFAEAAYTQNVIASFAANHPDSFVVFGGDLNDTPSDASIIQLEKDGVLIRDAANLEESTVYTWKNTIAIDHLFHNALLSPYLAKTERVCGSHPANGLGTSDHCALKSTFIFPVDGDS